MVPGDESALLFNFFGVPPCLDYVLLQFRVPRPSREETNGGGCDGRSYGRGDGEDGGVEEVYLLPCLSPLF